MSKFYKFYLNRDLNHLYLHYQLGNSYLNHFFILFSVYHKNKIKLSGLYILKGATVNGMPMPNQKNLPGLFNELNKNDN